MSVYHLQFNPMSFEEDLYGISSFYAVPRGDKHWSVAQRVKIVVLFTFLNFMWCGKQEVLNATRDKDRLQHPGVF